MPEHNLTLDSWALQAVSYCILLLAFGVIFFIAERIRPIQTGEKFSREKWTEIWIAFIDKLLIFPVALFGLTYFFRHVVEPHVPYQMFSAYIYPLPLWFQVSLGLIILDLLVYFRHRFTHMFLWPVHAIHHTTQYVNWLTSLRLHPVEVLVDIIFSMSILYFIGFDGDAMSLAVTIVFAFNLLTHTNINLEWPGVFHYLIGSPNYHRWHHARTETEAFDKNFAVIFPFIDIVFGTYYHPKGKLPQSYGIYSRPGDTPLPPTLWGHLLYPFKKKQIK